MHAKSGNSKLLQGRDETNSRFFFFFGCRIHSINQADWTADGREAERDVWNPEIGSRRETDIKASRWQAAVGRRLFCHEDHDWGGASERECIRVARMPDDMIACHFAFIA